MSGDEIRLAEGANNDYPWRKSVILAVVSLKKTTNVTNFSKSQTLQCFNNVFSNYE